MYVVEYETPTGNFTSSPFSTKEAATSWARKMSRSGNFSPIEIRKAN